MGPVEYYKRGVELVISNINQYIESIERELEETTLSENHEPTQLNFKKRIAKIPMAG